MNSKKLDFQVKNLTHKKQLLNIQLTQLIDTNNDLLANQINSQLDTSDTSDTSNTSTTSNTNITIPDSQQILDTLTSNKQQLLQDLKLIKTQIKNLSKTKDILLCKQKELPTIKTKQIDNELQIKKDELERVFQKHIDVNNQYIDLIYNEYDNKIDLQNKIINLQNDINQQTNKLTSIQETVHMYRHDTLNSLKLKKHEKHQYNNTVKILNDKETYVQNTIDNLTIQLKNLQQFKTDIIDNNYNTDVKTNAKYSIPDICIQLNIIDISYMDLNNQVEYIDLQIDNIKNQIKKYTTQFNNLIYENKKKLHSLPTDTTNTTNSTNTTNTTNTTNKLNFKDILKLEKKLTNELNEQYDHISNIYINYDNTIIKQHVINFQNDKQELLEDKQRAIDRFNIMNQRINDEYNENNNKLQMQIISIVSIQLAQLQKQMSDNIENTIILDNQIESQFGKIIKVNEINDKIQKLQTQITQIDKDINTYILSNSNYNNNTYSTNSNDI